MLRSAAVALLLFTGALPANETIAAGSPLALAVKKKVQDELKLTAEQADAVRKLYDDAAKDEKAAPADALAKELKPEQLARLRQISVQVRGGSALADAGVVKELGLSLTQKRKVATVWKNGEEDLRQILKVTRFRTPAAKRRFVLEHRRDVGKEMLKLLTDDQAAALKAMQGAAVEAKGLDD